MFIPAKMVIKEIFGKIVAKSRTLSCQIDILHFYFGVIKTAKSFLHQKARKQPLLETDRFFFKSWNTFIRILLSQDCVSTQKTITIQVRDFNSKLVWTLVFSNTLMAECPLLQCACWCLSHTSPTQTHNKGTVGLILMSEYYIWRGDQLRRKEDRHEKAEFWTLDFRCALINNDLGYQYYTTRWFIVRAGNTSEFSQSESRKKICRIQ
jgi:hypothetical protein